MSDYGDDGYSDYGDEWMWVEDTYMPADDLAEHAVNSPPPTDYLDEDAIPDWDQFDYFNDLEYGSDGYDDTKYYTQKPEDAKVGEKRKRGGVSRRGNKRQKQGDVWKDSTLDAPPSTLSPVVWRSKEVPLEPKMLDEKKAPSYALFKDWRNHMAKPPSWGKKKREGVSVDASELVVSEDVEEWIDEDIAEEDEGEEESIDPTVLMNALKSRLAEAGGPLNGMDPQQLLQFAMRMMTDQDAGDDIAGELADNMLNQVEEGDDDEDEEVPADLLSWLSRQQKEGKEAVGPTPKSPEANYGGDRPPTPPSSEANRTIKVPGDANLGMSASQASNAVASSQNATIAVTQGRSSRKRKAADDVGEEDVMNVSKKKSTRSYDAPTAASQARATVAPPKATRSARAKR
ncbi:hypothetical protein BDV96DRAFT_600856 [Lophiotrema nucula]|uniref:Uncharacterized protein n=1 Tax=Lophiotrema nucula TaxID=690887 RepID=A0A6A5Z3S7_9PLEO|nr:hypothetical protein BDV96DRAFT_600856 [Lophiotrema nucula]